MIPAHIVETARPFDASAEGYAEFEAGAVAAAQRDFVHERIAPWFSPGDHVLEINCGNGTDALRLAARGVDVTATDESSAMLDVARARPSPGPGRVRFIRADFHDLTPAGEGPFDGALSNFGGLNCASDPAEVISGIARRLRPGAVFAATLLNRYCAWETLAFAARGNLTAALRRHSAEPVRANLPGGSSVDVRYFTPWDLEALLSPWFDPVELSGIGVTAPLPGSAAGRRGGKLVSRLVSVDRFISRLPGFRSLGDHFLIIARRTA